MTETKGKKALSLCILRVLEQHASEKDPLSTRRIIEYLKEDFGMIAERKAVGRNLILLTEMGFGLSTYHENGKGYYLTGAGNPETFDPILYDALLRAPITEEGDRHLRRMRQEVPIYSVQETPITLHTEVFETLDILREAIAKKVQVTFLYHTAHGDDGMTAMPDATYTVSPYALFLAAGRYHVLTSVSGYGRLLHFRCDYMRETRLTEQPVRNVTKLSECKNGLDVVGYVNRAVYRQDTSETYVLLCSGQLADTLCDTFGSGIHLTPDGENMRVEFKAPWTAVRKFVLSHLSQVSLLSPERRQKQIRDELYVALSLYPQR